MRISDWSSDVCSSDLFDAFDDRVLDLAAGGTRARKILGVEHFGRKVTNLSGRQRLEVIFLDPPAGHDVGAESVKDIDRAVVDVDEDRICDRPGEDLLEETFLQVQKLGDRSEEHTSELQSLMRISYAVFCLK